MDDTAADLQFTAVVRGTFLRDNPVFGSAEGLTDRTAEPLFQAQGGFKTVNGGLGHAEAVAGIVAQRVQGTQGFDRSVASAEDDRIDLSTQQAAVD